MGPSTGTGTGRPALHPAVPVAHAHSAMCVACDAEARREPSRDLSSIVLENGDVGFASCLLINTKACVACIDPRVV